MFTGLIDSVGVIESIGITAAGIELTISNDYADLIRGESVSVNGVCLTVLEHKSGSFVVAAMTVTVGRTSIGHWRQGRRVNLERAMRAESRFGGHIVQGHSDGVGTVAGVSRSQDAQIVDIALPSGLAETLVLHGSVALDGVSLTVNRLDGDMLQVALIDFTQRRTTLGDVAKGEAVNVETDVIGKYVKRIVTPYLNASIVRTREGS